MALVRKFTSAFSALVLGLWPWPLHVSGLDFIVPRTRTKFGDCAFSVAGSTVWNSLLESVRSAETLASSKRKLKTYLFDISF